MYVNITYRGTVESVEIPDELVAELGLDAQVTFTVTANVVASSQKRMRRTGEVRTVYELDPIDISYVNGNGEVHVEPQPDVSIPKVPSSRAPVDEDVPDLEQDEDGAYKIPQSSDSILNNFLDND